MIPALVLMFFIIVISIALGLLVPSSIYIKKYIKNNNEKIKTKLIFSIFGLLIGVCLLLIPIYCITFAIMGFPEEITWTRYTAENGVKDIENIVKIEQLIRSSIDTTETHYGFLKAYMKGYPGDYCISFNDISEQVKKLKFKYIKFDTNEMIWDIIDINHVSDIRIGMMREHSGWGHNEEKNKKFIEARGINFEEFEENKNDKLREFDISYKLNFDIDLVDYFTVIYDMDIELKSGEIIKVSDIIRFNKEIIKERTTESKPLFK